MGDDQSPSEFDRPAHPVTISAFRLDRYEVTVGRYRAYLRVYDHLPKPQEGDGAPPGHPGAGWVAAWNTPMASSAASAADRLRCSAKGEHTWTAEPEGQESNPINCVSFQEAFAFCLWDGGRLPTEAEWEYAAVGGNEGRLYPWGNQFQVALVNVESLGYVIDVGRAGNGESRGRWGQYDLVGNVWEWTRDEFKPYQVSAGEVQVDPVVPLGIAGWAVHRGFSYFDSASYVSARYRNNWVSDSRVSTIGFRCAREPRVDGLDAGVVADAFSGAGAG